MTTPGTWPDLPPYEAWQATCDTLHAHSQLLGKLAVAVAPPEPQLQHAALRLTARGWETAPLPAPNGSGTFVVVLDLRHHDMVVEHNLGDDRRIPLSPDRPVGAVVREVLGAVEELAGSVAINPRPQEVPWDVPLDEDDEHRTYAPEQVARYFAAATQAGLVLARLRAPYLGRSTPVNAWWGTFDLAVSLFSGRSAEPPSHDFIMRNTGRAQQVEVGWWPGDARYPRPAFFAFATPAPDGLSQAVLPATGGRWEEALGEYLFDWTDVAADADPVGAVVAFGQAVIAHACAVCGWDPVLAASALGDPPPVI